VYVVCYFLFFSWILVLVFRREKSLDILSITEESYLKQEEVSELYKVICLTIKREKDHKDYI